MIDQQLHELLRCPKCHADLDQDEAGQRLVCTGCGLAYPVRDGIPIMLIEEAEQTRDTKPLDHSAAESAA